MAITLVTTTDLSSFALLVQKQFQYDDDWHCVGDLVKYLWLMPLVTSDYNASHTILKSCINIEALACDHQILKLAIANHSHSSCLYLTLMLSSSGWEVSSLSTSRGREFLGKLTHLRVWSQLTVPRSPGFQDLTHISYSIVPEIDKLVEGEEASTPWMLNDPHQTYPSLQHVVLTKRVPSPRPPARLGSMLVITYISNRIQEIELWRQSISENSLWCAITEASKRP